MPIELTYETGHTWRLHELPPRSIALDGAVQGPAFDPQREVYSFDHHAGCVRHATLATCEQVRDAIHVGLDPSGFRVFANDVDADTVLSLWLLRHPERLTADARLPRLVRRIGRVDALGPAAGSMPSMGRLLTPVDGLVRDRPLLLEKLELLDRWWRREPLPRPPHSPIVEALWLEREAGSWRLRRGRVSRGFEGLYRRADFGVIFALAPAGTLAYVVGKRSEFVHFDVPAFLAACDRREPGWGGGSSIGGAPRRPDGRRSELSPEEVGELLRQVAASS